MADVNVSYKNADVHGRAAFEELDRFIQDNLLAGSEPALSPAMSLPQKASTTLAQFTVVGFDVNNEIVAAAAPDAGTPIKPFGIVAHASAVGVGGGKVQVWYTGCFNLDGPLVWGASFNTEAEKLNAFIGSPSPSNIIVRKRTTPTA